MCACVCVRVRVNDCVCACALRTHRVSGHEVHGRLAVHIRRLGAGAMLQQQLDQLRRPYTRLHPVIHRQRHTETERQRDIHSQTQTHTPLPAAMCSGVSPFRSVASTLALFASRSDAVKCWLYLALLNKGVFPSWSSASALFLFFEIFL